MSSLKIRLKYLSQTSIYVFFPKLMYVCMYLCVCVCTVLSFASILNTMKQGQMNND